MLPSEMPVALVVGAVNVTPPGAVFSSATCTAWAEALASADAAVVSAPMLTFAPPPTSAEIHTTTFS